jgi:phosphoglycerate dehydrogenase-like enzyme
MGERAVSEILSVAVLDDYEKVARRLAPWNRLGDHLEVAVFTDHLTDEHALIERLKNYDVLLAMRERTRFPASVIAQLPRLRLLVTKGMANEAIDVEAARARGVVVCGTAASAASTAELTWALILCLTRHLHEEDAEIRAGGWAHTLGPELAGRTLGLLGVGRLGTRVAGYGHAFGMRVIGWSQNLDPWYARSVGVEPTPLDELLRDADIVSIHLKLSDRTAGLIGRHELSLMSSDAYLVNTSRGHIVDEDALLEALETGGIAGAALDVYAVEPLPKHHRLRRAPNTLLSPHLGYVARDTYRLYFEQAVENIEAWRRGEPRRVL